MEEGDCSDAAPLHAAPLSKTPKPCEDEAWIAQCKRAKLLSTQWLDCGIVCLTVFLLVMCAVSYIFCPNCLFAILMFCAILCPCVHPLNAPLWLAIVLLTLSGWSFTVGAFSVSWGTHK